MATFAVIKTGGKQYKVSKGDSLKIEKIKAKTSTATPNQATAGFGQAGPVVSESCIHPSPVMFED